VRQCLVLSLGKHNPSSRIRLRSYQSLFRRAGWELRFHHFHSGMGREVPRNRRERMVERLFRWGQTLLVGVKLLTLPRQAPIIVNREMPISPLLLELVSNPVILDIDDALYLGPGREHVLRIARRADLVVCGNELISEALLPHCERTEVIPTVVDCESFRPAQNPLPPHPLKLGWLGSSLSVDFTLKPFLPVLDELRSRLDFRLVVVVDGQPSYLQRRPWVDLVEWSQEAEKVLGELFHIGLMPLEQDPFQAAKCGCKLIQYMACGLPSVATSVGVNRSILQEGKTGYLAGNAGQWHDALLTLAHDPVLRTEVGRVAREVAVQSYSLNAWEARWIELLSNLTRADRIRSTPVKTDR